ncbi:MAG: DUF4398 domain-containing protein [Woeseiaceae bacterium]|nr:DUF4398 domain-containing protein [Woeseiaceae bacterium]
MHAVESITKPLLLLQLALLSLLAACQTAPPVQEMSDARQAIAVAKEAGAEQTATSQLQEAEAYLDSARQNLTDKRYAQARRDAVSAKLRALEALAVAERQTPEPR